MVKEIVVHTISMGDVEDPDLMVADPIWKWQQTDQGKFVMENSVQTPRWLRAVDPSTYGYKYSILAEFDEKKLVEYYLRWGPINRSIYSL